MSHSDDNGLILPFKIAPIQIGIIVLANDDQTNDYVQQLRKNLKKYRIDIDTSNKSFGFKINQYQIQGVPFCFVIGKKEVNDKIITIISRDNNQKISINCNNIKTQLYTLINQYNHNLFTKAKGRLQSSIVQVNNFDQFKTVITNKKIALAYFNDSCENENKIKQLTGATARCIKKVLNVSDHHKCVLTNQHATHLIYFARAY
jgi:prolyl-tRNA synthetase